MAGRKKKERPKRYTVVWFLAMIHYGHFLPYRALDLFFDKDVKPPSERLAGITTITFVANYAAMMTPSALREFTSVLGFAVASDIYVTANLYIMLAIATILVYLFLWNDDWTAAYFEEFERFSGVQKFLLALLSLGLMLNPIVLLPYIKKRLF